MIDLHMHTTYSDGTDTVKEILENANKANLELISITDHNSCKAYIEMENTQIRNIFKGDIIVGCEFTTSYKGHMIEILGYGFDYKKVQTYLEKLYNNDAKNKYANTVYNKIVSKMHELGFTFNLPLVENRQFNTEFIESELYMELIKYPENKSKLDEDVFETFAKFFRKGLTNPKSKLYINHASLKPSLDEIINLVHSCNGLAFLAHPYQYGIADFDSFLDDLTNNYSIDGLECHYTTFSQAQTECLLNYTKNHNLLISGGSDYHAKNKKNHDLGKGRGNLNINRNILNNWKIKTY